MCQCDEKQLLLTITLWSKFRVYALFRNFRFGISTLGIGVIGFGFGGLNIVPGVSIELLVQVSCL